MFKYQLQREQNDITANSWIADSLGSTLLISACTASMYLQLYMISFKSILILSSIAFWLQAGQLMKWCYIPDTWKRLFYNPQFPYKLCGLQNHISFQGLEWLTTNLCAVPNKLRIHSAIHHNDVMLNLLKPSCYFLYHQVWLSYSTFCPTAYIYVFSLCLRINRKFSLFGIDRLLFITQTRASLLRSTSGSSYKTNILPLTLILLTWRIGRACNNARKWQMGFNLPFKGLKG
jgi:hypothetical protein